jgi:hypothetical protein
MSRGMFIPWIVRSHTYSAMSISCFVRVKVIERALSTFRDWSYITVMRIVAVIDVAVKVMATMEPGTGSDENTVNEPIRSIIAIGSTAIRLVVKVSVWAHRSRANVNRNLSGCHGHAAHQRNGESRESKRLPSGHNSS